jgi:hypothetical protein
MDWQSILPGSPTPSLDWESSRVYGSCENQPDFDLKLDWQSSSGVESRE